MRASSHAKTANIALSDCVLMVQTSGPQVLDDPADAVKAVAGSANHAGHTAHQAKSGPAGGDTLSNHSSNLSDTPQSVSEAAIGPGTGQDHGQLVLAEAGAVELLGHVDGLSYHLLDGLLLCLTGAGDNIGRGHGSNGEDGKQ